MKAFYLRNFRNGLATNSSSTHSVIYRNEADMFEDLNVFELDYYGRCDSTIAATREAKIKYVLANIMYNDELVKALLPKYPEMKQYFGKIKKKFLNDETRSWCDDDEFGMYCRGELYTGNMEYDIEYITEIIENPDIVIVGGSDEMDFVYDTTENHEDVVEPSDFTAFGVRYTSYDNLRHYIHRNGNYWVAFGTTRLARVPQTPDDDEYYDRSTAYKRHCSVGRTRFSTTKGNLLPEYPELIDLRITNKCNHGCPFCFMDSNNKDVHMRKHYIDRILNGCGEQTEFSIGGGNILLYPDLEYVLSKIKSRGHIVNVTVNVKDCDTIINDEKIKDIFMKYVDGIGISVTKATDIDEVERMYRVFHDSEFFNNNPAYRSKYITCHMIPEYIGVDTVRELMELHRQRNIWTPFLFLGYKTNGRGINCEHKKFTDDELERLFKDSFMIAIDTTFANTYYDWLDKNFAISKCITLNEGEFSLYVDGVNETIHKSSYQLEKPYRLREYVKKEIEMNPVKANAKEVECLKDAFNSIRKDGGLQVYKKSDFSYYSDAELPYYEEEDE